MAKLIGTGANQVPTNADLGKLAYQDAIANGTGTAGQVLQSGGATGSPAWADAGGGVPAGSVIYHAANSAPTGFIKANGAAVSRSTYSDLFTAIGTTFGAGDGSSTFNVPDLRGEFPRGWDDSRGIDSGRSFGSAQADQLEQHRHDTPVQVSNTFSTFPSAGYSSGSYETVMNGREGDETIRYSGYTGGTDNSSENRPRNIALLACIKY
jgi:microcystin-dependent protein